MMAINMSYTTNFATNKPVVCEESSDPTFGSGRDIAYLVFSILQFFTTWFGLVYVYIFIRRKDEKDKKERLEKEERDTIADIINNEYDKIVQGDIDVNLKKCKEEFEAMVMFYGTVSKTGERKDKITGLQVLRFMLLNPNDFKDKKLKEFQKDLEAVQKLFRALRLKLPLKGDCPINIKEELGPLITGVGEIARSFVSARKRYTISIVLNYFGNVQENVGSIHDEEIKDEEHSKKIRRILPYVNGVSLGNIRFDCYANDETTFVPRLDHVQVISDLRSIESLRNIEANQLGKLAKKIEEIWPKDIPKPDWSEKKHLNANIIHAGRVFWFKVAEDNDIIQNEGFRKLVEEMKITLAQCSVEQEEISFKAIGNIQNSMQRLGLSRQCLHQICGEKSIASMLDEVSKFIENSICQAEGSN